MKDENEEDQEHFSDDPDEQLRMENELLKLKMQAQFGAFFGDGTEELPPEIEQEFLKQVLAFQENASTAPLLKLHDVIGNPDYAPSTAIPEEQLPAQWEKLEQQLADHNLLVTFEGEYPLATKYDFVIRELFPLEIQQPQEGHNWVFPYEEFHPNHTLSLERAVEHFMEDFFGHKMAEEAPYLAGVMVTDKDEVLTIQELMQKVDRFHHLFREVKDYSYEVAATNIDESQAEEDAVLGLVEGTVAYNVLMEDGTEQTVQGPFQCCFQYEEGYWELYFFSLHGFSWS